jgi:hypothetical protein
MRESCAKEMAAIEQLDSQEVDIPPAMRREVGAASLKAARLVSRLALTRRELPLSGDQPFGQDLEHELEFDVSHYTRQESNLQPMAP